MKKLLSCMLVLTLALSLFSSPAVAEEHAPVTLEVCIVDTNWADAWLEMKASFEKQYPWITLESVGSDQNITEFISARIAANDLPGVIKLTISDIYLDMIEVAGHTARLSPSSSNLFWRHSWLFLSAEACQRQMFLSQSLSLFQVQS